MRFLPILLLFLAACNVTNQSSPNESSETLQSPEIQCYVAYWMGSEQALNSDSVLVGCQTYVSPLSSNIPSTRPEANISASLSQLFTVHSETGQRNVWGDDLDLVVDSVSIENARATIQLSGTMMMRGVCADVEMEAQLLLTVFAESSVESALIMLGDTNMRSYFDGSGQAGNDFIYTRENIPYATP